jgi:hypothetical protein
LETHLERQRAAPVARSYLLHPTGERWDQELMALSISIIRNKPDIDSPISFVVARSLIVIKTNKAA